jgi:hypothetical protein
MQQQFTNPEAERQFQHAFAARRRCYKALFVAVAFLVPFANLLPLKARVQSCPAAPAPKPDGRAPDPTFARNDTVSTAAAAPELGSLLPPFVEQRRPRCLWGPEPWLHQTLHSLQQHVTNVGCIATLLWVFWTEHGAASLDQGLCWQLLAAWRMGQSLSGFLVLLLYKLRLQPGWPPDSATPGAAAYSGSNTLFEAAQLLWHARLAVVSPALLLCLL